MHGRRSDPVRLEALDQPVRPPLRLDEHQRPACLLLEEFGECAGLSFHGDGHEAVGHRVDRLLGRDRLVAARLVRVLAGEHADLAVKRGGEEHRLAPGSRDRHGDAVDLRLEAHIEETVRFVEHEDGHLFEADAPPLDQVIQATGCGDDDLRPGSIAGQVDQPDAAVDGCDHEALGLGDDLELLGDLGRELAGGDHHDRLGSGGRTFEPLDDRDGEGEGLARAGTALGEDVVSGNGVGDHPSLDLEGRDDPPGGQHSDDGLRGAELRKRGLGLDGLQL